MKKITLCIVFIIYSCNAMQQYTPTPLHLACVQGDKERVQHELALPGCKINKKDSIDYICQTPLFFACQAGHTDIVALLLAMPGINPNKEGAFNKVPLHAAANKEIAHLLLTHGAEVNSFVNHYFAGSDRSLLTAHLEAGHYDIAELLIDNGIDVRFPGDKGCGWGYNELYTRIKKAPLFYMLGKLDEGNDRIRVITEKLLTADTDVINVVCSIISSYRDHKIAFERDFRISYFEHNIDFLAAHHFHVFSYYNSRNKYNPVSFFETKDLLEYLYDQSENGPEKYKKAFRKSCNAVEQVFNALVPDDFPNEHYHPRVAVRELTYTMNPVLILYKANRKDLCDDFGEDIVTLIQTLMAKNRPTGD